MTFSQFLWNLSVVCLMIAVVLLVILTVRGNWPSVTDLSLVSIALLLASRNPS